MGVGLQAAWSTHRLHCHQLLENMYNLSFQAHGRPLRFDINGNVDMDYDLKLWVWQDQTPKLRTVGAFNGRLQLHPSRLRWHTPRNEVSVRLRVPSCMSASPQPHLGEGVPRSRAGTQQSRA